MSAKKQILFTLCVTALLAACQARQPAAEPTQAQFTITLSKTATALPSPTRPPTLTQTPTNTATQTPIPTATATPTPIPTSVFAPVIQDTPGAIYETLFTIPVEPGSPIRYQEGCCGMVGPNALAVLPDGSFLISDMVFDPKRLLHYSPAGKLLDIISLQGQDIAWVYQIQVRQDTLYLLTRSYQDQTYAVIEMTLDGKVLATHPFSGTFSISGGHTLDGAIGGMMLDCEDNILLVIAGGSSMYRLTDVESHTSHVGIPNGFACQGDLYHKLNIGQGNLKRFAANGYYLSTTVMDQFGGLSLLAGFADGSFLLDRTDVILDSAFRVDDTIHFVGPDGQPHGAARLPLAERYYSEYLITSITVSERGEVFVLHPLKNSISIVRLNFYAGLEPFMPGAAAPVVTSQEARP